MSIPIFDIKCFLAGRGIAREAFSKPLTSWSVVLEQFNFVFIEATLRIQASQCHTWFLKRGPFAEVMGSTVMEVKRKQFELTLEKCPGINPAEGLVGVIYRSKRVSASDVFMQ